MRRLGDLPATARTACDELARIRPTLAATACAASVDSVSGHADRAYNTLEIATARAPSRDPSLQCWALTILAEIAERRDDPAAEQHFKDALVASPADVYTLTAYADYLLEQKRPAEVTALLAGKNRIDALLLRLALAARDSGDPKAGAYGEELAARYAAARARGEQLHLRDESRFELELLYQPGWALELARQNWEMQRTPDRCADLSGGGTGGERPGGGQAGWPTGSTATGLEDRALRDDAGEGDAGRNICLIALLFLTMGKHRKPPRTCRPTAICGSMSATLRSPVSGISRCATWMSPSGSMPTATATSPGARSRPSGGRSRPMR